jgi:1-acyl-sn-glycerol-3-phosphate acyltransferase
MRHIPEKVPQATEDLLRPLLERLREFHRYEVRGMEHVPDQGAALVVFTHSLATYDIILFGARVYIEKQRLIASLVDRLIFKIPVVRQIAEHIAATEGKPEEARALLAAGRLVGVAPGGMREALRDSDHRYRVSWERRYGFVKLALQTRVPVILTACPAADRIYTVVDNPVTRFVYQRFRVPLPLAIGLGPLPRPIRLVCYVRAPILPPPIAGSEPTHEEVHAFHAELVREMEKLIALGTAE